MATEGKNEQNEKPLGLNEESKEKDSKTWAPASPAPEEKNGEDDTEVSGREENNEIFSDNESEPSSPSEIKVKEAAGDEDKGHSHPTDAQLNEGRNMEETGDDASEEKKDGSEVISSEPRESQGTDTEPPKPGGDKKEESADHPPLNGEQNAVSPELEEHPHAEHAHEEEALEENLLDYSGYTKKQLVQVLESLLKSNDISQVGKILKEIKPVYDELYTAQRDKAYKKYLDEGGEKDGFEYKDDELDRRFREAYNTLKERRYQYINSLDKQREDNLKAKQNLLERLRHLVDSEETTASIADLKKIEQEWREIGPVAPQHARSLWANFHALRNRYYDHRSIYFELKELDRKKNLNQKLQLVEKAEQLDQLENIKEAIRELNELHEEFKLIGPVPAEEQEPLWQRFKAASDRIYTKRKQYYEELKERFKLNLQAKQALIEKIQEFEKFDSDRITEWNAKTKELLALQKEWESVGGLPKDKAKKINKAFWSSFKSFFNRKGQFFKKLEEGKRENLAKKQALMETARELRNSDDFEKTAETLKNLQKQWREIGPVPEKYKNKVYKEFKEACDTFFNRRRKHLEEIESTYKDNLKLKEELCSELEKMTDGDIDLKRVTEIQEQWGSIGFVPRNAMKSIQKRFVDAINKLADAAEIPEEEKHVLKFKARFSKMNYGPNADKFLQKKENTLRRQISKLENDISLWKNNLDFFANSRTAEKLKHDFNKRISSAERELKELKDQLKVLNSI